MYYLALQFYFFYSISSIRNKKEHYNKYNQLFKYIPNDLIIIKLYELVYKIMNIYTLMLIEDIVINYLILILMILYDDYELTTNEK